MKNRLLAGSVLLLASASLTAQWDLITPAASPVGRGAQGMCFDPTTGGVLMFGGDTFGFPSGASNQTWSYDGSTWTQRTPAVSPPASVGVHLVYDSNRGVFVTYGSLNTSLFGGASADRTWEYDGTNWTQVFPVHTPGGLGLYGMTFDSLRNKVVLYGGMPDNFFPIDVADTWEYDGTDWTLVTTSNSPGPLERPAMCFHAGAGKTVLFGGLDVQIGGVDTTWLYDGTDWTVAAVTGTKPAPRTGPRMVYDDFRAICVMTGGQDMNGTQLDDTWEFDLANLTWTQVPTAYTGGRLDAGLAFLPSRRQVVLFGGFNYVTFTAYADTWEFGAKSATFGTGCAGSNGVPAIDAVDAPRLGQNYTIQMTGLNPAVNLGVLVLGGEIAPVPLDFLGMTNCTAYVSPDVMLTSVGAAGTTSWTAPLNSSVSLIGATIFAQGISLDPAGNPAWLVASNAHKGTLGR